MSVKIVWENPETVPVEFRDQVTGKLLGKISMRAGVTQAFINMTTALNMQGGVAGAKATIRLKTHIAKASAYVKMSSRSFEQTLEAIDIIEYTDKTTPKYDVRVLIGVVPNKKQTKKFFEGRHRQIICLASELDELREELFGNDDKSTYIFRFNTGDGEELDEAESNLS